jgi:hypothetical protein
MNTFDNAVKSIMETVTIKESYDEYDIDVSNLELDGFLVSEILPNDPAGDDVFVLDAGISMPYSLYKGEEQSWDSPGEEPHAEIDDVKFINPKILRYSQANDNYTEVTPEMVGQDVYNGLLAKLKDQATEPAINNAYDNIDVEQDRGY